MTGAEITITLMGGHVFERQTIAREIESALASCKLSVESTGITADPGDEEHQDTIQGMASRKTSITIRVIT